MNMSHSVASFDVAKRDILEKTMVDLLTSGEAAFSFCGRYRYTLERTWRLDAPRLLIVMLNPSTADASVDDHTTRKCLNFADRTGFGSYCAVNLFAFRSKTPKIMLAADDPIGPSNDSYLRRELNKLRPDSDRVVVAWGVHGVHLSRDREVLRIIRGIAIQPRCFSMTKDDHPRHPTYGALKELIPFGT